MQEEIERVATAYLGIDAPGLIAHPLLEEANLTQAAGHVYALAELAGLVPQEQPGLMRIAGGYALLSAHYVLVDDSLDAQRPAGDSLLTSGQFLALFLSIANEEVCDRLPVETRPAVRQRMLARLAQRDHGLRLELERRASWTAPAEDEYEIAVAESSLTLLTFELLCALAGHEPPKEAIEALSEFLYGLQMADDLVDWREDLAKNNHTLMLRRCAQRFPAGAEPTEDDIERELYLGGLFEEAAAELAVHFERVSSAFVALKGFAAAAYSRRAYAKVVDNLKAMVGAKVEYLAANRP